jgi:hypothetical protein
MTALLWISTTIILIAMVACAFALCDASKIREADWNKNKHKYSKGATEDINKLPMYGAEPKKYTESEMISFGYYCFKFLDETTTHTSTAHDPLKICFEKWKVGINL